MTAAVDLDAVEMHQPRQGVIGAEYSSLVRRDWRTDWPPERLEAVANVNGARYVEATETVRLALHPTGSETLNARTIIELGGLFLVETVDEPDDWYMGQRAPDGEIHCWGRYGDLETALRCL